MIRLSRFVTALGIAAILASPLAASAQPAPAAPPVNAASPAAHKHHHHRSAYMSSLRKLNLSDAQRQQIRGIMQTAHNAPKTTDPAARRANAKQVRAQIDAVLTPAQRTQLKASMDAARANRPASGT